MSLLLVTGDYEDDIESMKVMVEQVKKRLADSNLKLKPRTDYEFLSKFIRLRKYNVENAVTAVCRYYNGISLNFEKFNDLVVSDISHVYNKSSLMKFLRTKVENKIVITFRLANWNTDEMTLEEIMLGFTYGFEELFNDRDFLESGCVIIVDWSGLTFTHVTQFGYRAIKFCMKMIFDVYQIRLAGFHFIKPPLIFWPVFKIMEKFMPVKIRGRVHFHSEVNNLLDIFPAEALPKCIGGNLDENDAYEEVMFSDLIRKNTRHSSYWKVDLNEET